MRLTQIQFIFLLTLIVTVVNSQGIYPCHSGREQLGSAECTVVTLPHDLCTKCPLKEVAWNGDFKDCRSIYNIDAPGCQGQLIEYVNMNWCDWRRAEQVDQWINGGDEWTKNQAKEKLDYFVYAICEECCDCIPLGAAHLDHSTAQQNEDWLYHHSRGNCAAHAFYDICRLLPNIKGFKNPGEDWESHAGKPNICWPLTDWFNVNQDWRFNHNADASWDIQVFLKNVNQKIKCGSEQMWTNCKNMEIQQGNIWSDPGHGLPGGGNPSAGGGNGGGDVGGDGGSGDSGGDGGDGSGE